MAKDKPSFILYADLLHVIKKLVLQDRANKTNHAGELFLHILEYVNDNNPVPIDFIVDMAFEPIKQQLKRDLKKYELFREKQSENGKMGGRPHKEEETQIKPENPSLILESQKSLNGNVTVNANDTVTATVNETVTVKEITPAPAKISRKKKHPTKQPLSFRDSEYFDKEKFSSALANSPPPYCNANVDFYYDACLNGSDSKGYTYLDWSAAVKNWMRKDVAAGKFQSIVSEPIKIVPGGKSNYQTGRKQAGFTDAELAAAMEKRGRVG